MPDQDWLTSRMAIEALRAGVPNRAAIRSLLPDARISPRLQKFLERFREGLDACERGLETGRAVQGMIVAGGFGSGKSHLLGMLREEALAAGFVVSLLPISKETQLFHPGRLFAAAVLAAEVPEAIDRPGGRTFGEPVNDDAVVAVVRGLKSNQAGYDALVDWVASAEAGLAPLFQALLYLLPHQRIEPEKVAEIAAFFAGGQLSPRKVREWLAQIGAARRFDTKKPPQSELDRQRVVFFPRLLRAAGYRGWCLLLDELELVGRYGLKQRARSYAELGHWLGLDGAGVPGCLVVGATTDDFVEEILEGRNDFRNVPHCLATDGPQKLRAEAAMNFIKSQTSLHRLPAPREDELEACLERVIGLYRLAYRHGAQVALGGRRVGKTLREFIKGWITQLDVDRLFGETVEIVHEPPSLMMSEDERFEQGPDIAPPPAGG